MTARQRRVVELIADGLENKEIAPRVGISEAGVRKHVEALFRHYGVVNRASLVRAAIKAGDVEALIVLVGATLLGG